MKRWVIRVIVALALVGLLAFAGYQAYFEAMKRAWIRYNEFDVRSEGVLVIGDAIPDLELAELDGDRVALSDLYREKPLVLVFGSYT